MKTDGAPFCEYNQKSMSKWYKMSKFVYVTSFVISVKIIISRKIYVIMCKNVNLYYECLWVNVYLNICKLCRYA